jgi:hypothetical protein
MSLKVPVSDAGMLAESSDPASEAGLSGAGWMRAYVRCVAGVQLLYALVFGFWAIARFDILYQGLVQTEGVSKGGYQKPYLDKHELLMGTILALLSLCSFVGGSRLFEHRSSVRRWEIAYLVFLLVLVAVFVASSFVRSSDSWTFSEDLNEHILFFLIFALPYVPFLFISRPPCRSLLIGEAETSKPDV